MTSLVAPGGEFGSKQDTADPLGKVDFAFLDVRAFLHKLVLGASLEHEIVN